MLICLLRLQAKLPADNEKRSILLQTCIVLYNYRVRKGIANQIATVYSNEQVIQMLQ